MPSSIVAGAVVLSVVMIAVSESVNRNALAEYPRIFGAGAQSSRQMLSTIATAIMTVAGVTFSITMVAVTQASSQYTPRILRNFMRDRTSQVTLGSLTGVFVYCLLVMRTVRDQNEGGFIPAPAVLLAFPLAIVAVGMLIYFIHHMTEALQASGVLSRVQSDTIAAVERLFPDALGEEPPIDAPQLPPAEAWKTVPARRTGYITSVDGSALLALADEHDVLVRMERGVGEYVIAGTPLVSVAPGERVDAKLAATLETFFERGAFRTVKQDVTFGVLQMVDIAVKALSPGVNDTSTAISSIDAMGGALARLATRRIESPYRLRNGRLRLIARAPTFDDIVSSGVDEIRRSASGNTRVLVHLTNMLGTIGECTTSPARRGVLLAHAQRLLETTERTVANADDRVRVRVAYGRAYEALAGRNDH